MLDYTVTNNRIHRQVRDEGRNEIGRSRQFIGGRTGQEYDRRKQRNGGSCEDRDHATAVESGEHLARCLVYIDLDRVRADIVSQPAQWASGSYHEIQSAPAHHRIIDRAALAETLGVPLCTSSATHTQWVDTALCHGPGQRARRATMSLAVGNREEFVERIETESGHRAVDSEVQPFGATFLLHDRSRPATVTFFRPKTSL